MPVEVQGLNGVPLAGDDFTVAADEGQARDIAAFRQRRRREQQAAQGARGTLEQMFSQIAAGAAKELAVVVKSDVQGSLEAIVGSLEKLSSDEVKLRVLHSAVGGITESDVTLAKASAAVIVGFNVRANPQARDMARRDGVEIRAFLSNEVAKWWLPDAIEFVSELPHTASGKLSKKDLRDQYRDYRFANAPEMVGRD